jgi:hypothetical protein
MAAARATADEDNDLSQFIVGLRMKGAECTK